VLEKKMRETLRVFPNIDDCSMFYVELIRTTLDYKKLKLSLGSLNWVIGKVQDQWRVAHKQITKADELDKLHTARRAYYGRVSSFVKRIDKHLRYLEDARKVMRKYPSIKTSINSVTISGFPNAGKTTLLFKLTGSKPEIAAYAFTTTGINVGMLMTKKGTLLDL